MPLIQKLSLRQTVSALAISSIMIVGGCKSKTGGADEVSDAAVSISQKDYGDIGDVLKVPARKVDTDESERALKAIGLWDEGETVKWSERSGGEGTYTFKNIATTDSEGQSFKAAHLTLAGLRMDGDRPVADLVDMGDLTLTGENVSLSIDNLGLTDIALSKNIAALSEIDDLLDFDVFDLDDDKDTEGPKSFVMSGVKGQSEKAEFSIANVGWGQDPRTSHLRFAAKDLTITAAGDRATTIKLASANARGLEAIAEDDAKAAGNDFLDLLAQGQGLGNVEIKGLEVTSDFLDFNMPSLTQNVTKKGDVMQGNFNMPTMTIAFEDTGDLPAEMRSGMAVLETLGFDELVFSSKGQTELNETTDLTTIKAVSLDLKDGFDLNYKGNFSGFSGMRNLGSAPTVEDIEAAQDKIKIHDFALSLEDKSIVERGFKLAGEMTEQKPEDLRRQIKGVLALGSLAAFTQDDGAIYSEFTKALGDFIEEGGTLNIALNPETPLALSDFDDLSRGKKPDLNRLGFSSSTTR